MGYAVLHLEKAKGADSGMSAHIERTKQPKNADPTMDASQSRTYPVPRWRPQQNGSHTAPSQYGRA